MASVFSEQWVLAEKKTPAPAKNLGGVFKNPPSSRDQEVILQRPQGVFTDDIKAREDYSANGIPQNFSLLERKQILT